MSTAIPRAGWCCAFVYDSSDVQEIIHSFDPFDNKTWSSLTFLFFSVIILRSYIEGFN